MNPKVRFKLTIIIAIIAVLGITLFFADSSFPSQGITILEEDLFCNTVEDCTSIDLSCDSCNCNGTAINKQSFEKYSELREQTCENYQGVVCKIRCEPQLLECTNNKCVSPDDAQ